MYEYSYVGYLLSVCNCNSFRNFNYKSNHLFESLKIWYPSHLTKLCGNNEEKDIVMFFWALTIKFKLTSILILKDYTLIMHWNIFITLVLNFGLIESVTNLYSSENIEQCIINCWKMYQYEDFSFQRNLKSFYFHLPNLRMRQIMECRIRCGMNFLL